MTTTPRDSAAAKRILATASDLFYRNGYRATGINEIIDKSGVAKATFYAHFPSKESLALAYVKSMKEEEGRAIEAYLKKCSGPYEKLLGLLDFVITWFQERDYRGCRYLNIAAEITDHSNPMRVETRNHYSRYREVIGRLMKDLKAERGPAWKGKDPEKLADDFFLIFVGAMAMAPLYRDPQPFRDAIAWVKRELE